MKWHFEKWEGNSPSIVALHGFGGSGLDFDHVAKKSAYSWLALDCLGHGNSPLSNKPQDYQHFNLAALLVEQLGGDSCLLGYSMGARLALWTAILYPRTISRLILIGASAGIQSQTDRKQRLLSDEDLAKAVLEQGVEDFMRDWSSKPIIQSQGRKMRQGDHQAMMSRRFNGHAPSLAASLRGFGQGVMPSAIEHLNELAIPTLIVCGQDDEKYQGLGWDLFKRIENSSMSIVAHSGHAPHLENPDDLALVIDRWMTAQN